MTELCTIERQNGRNREKKQAGGKRKCSWEVERERVTAECLRAY